MTKSMPAPQISQGINSAQLASMAQANKDNQAVHHPSSAEGGQPPTGGHFGLHPDAIDNHFKFHGSIDLGHSSQGIHIGALTNASENFFNHNLFAVFDGSLALVSGVGHGTELAGGISPSNFKLFEHEGAQMKPSGLPGFHNTEEHFTHK